MDQWTSNNAGEYSGINDYLKCRWILGHRARDCGRGGAEHQADHGEGEQVGVIEMEMPAGGCEEWEMVKTEEEDNIWQDCHCVMYIHLYIEYWDSKRTVWFRLNTCMYVQNRSSRVLHEWLLHWCNNERWTKSACLTGVLKLCISAMPLPGQILLEP